MDINQEALEELKKQLTPLNGFKIIFGTLVSVGATAAVIAAFRNPINGVKGILRILMSAGAFVLGCKAGDIAEEYFKETVDNWTETISDISNEVKKLEGAEDSHGTNTGNGRNSQQQPEKQTSISRIAESAGKAAGASIWRRWRGEKKGTEQVLEMDAKDVSERQKPSGDIKGNLGESNSPGV